MVVMGINSNTKNLQNKEMKELYHLTIYNSSNVLPKKQEKKKGELKLPPLSRLGDGAIGAQKQQNKKTKNKKEGSQDPYAENS
jgi:hypothetical protein